MKKTARRFISVCMIQKSRKVNSLTSHTQITVDVSVMDKNQEWQCRSDAFMLKLMTEGCHHNCFQLKAAFWLSSYERIPTMNSARSVTSSPSEMWSSGTEKPTSGQKREHFTMKHSIKQFMARISDYSSKVDILIILHTVSPSVLPGISSYCSLNACRHSTHWNCVAL